MTSCSDEATENNSFNAKIDFLEEWLKESE
jgi:hypothetical protein